MSTLRPFSCSAFTTARLVSLVIVAAFLPDIFANLAKLACDSADMSVSFPNLAISDTISSLNIVEVVPNDLFNSVIVLRTSFDCIAVLPVSLAIFDASFLKPNASFLDIPKLFLMSASS